MQPEEVTSHKDCELGKWYFSEGQVLSDMQEYKELGIWHEKIHSTAKEIVRLCNTGQRDQADKKMSDFTVARENLFRLLDSMYLE